MQRHDVLTPCKLQIKGIDHFDERYLQYESLQSDVVSLTRKSLIATVIVIALNLAWIPFVHKFS